MNLRHFLSDARLPVNIFPEYSESFLHSCCNFLASIVNTKALGLCTSGFVLANGILDASQKKIAWVGLLRFTDSDCTL
jgi:hypothetical protein